MNWNELKDGMANKIKELGIGDAENFKDVVLSVIEELKNNTESIVKNEFGSTQHGECNGKKLCEMVEKDGNPYKFVFDNPKGVGNYPLIIQICELGSGQYNLVLLKSQVVMKLILM